MSAYSISGGLIIDIIKERQAQNAEWGGPDHDDEHDLEDWCSFIGKQVRLAEKESGSDSFRSRMVKVAALAVAAIEMFDRLKERG